MIYIVFFSLSEHYVLVCYMNELILINSGDFSGLIHLAN